MLPYLTTMLEISTLFPDLQNVNEIDLIYATSYNVDISIYLVATIR